MRRIQFSEFEIDLDLYTLRRGDVSIQIGRRAFDLLICLINNRDRIVSKDFLKQEVWKTTALSAAAIPTAILELRKVLGDDASAPRFIGSTRGRGYRFLGEISTEGHTEPRHADQSGLFDLVGRQNELHQLNRNLEQVISQRRGKVILVTGEAGIGKTRILREFLSKIARPTRSITIKSPTARGAPPFWLWTSLLRHSLNSGLSNQQLAIHAQALTAVFPELSNPPSTKTKEQPPLNRFSIITQWINAIKSLPNGGPLVIAFDDIHRADTDSLSLLSCIADEITSDPIMLIATHRPPPFDNEQRDRISEISATPNASTIELGPLTTADISSLLDPLDPHRHTISQALETRTSGNPFYLTQIIQYLKSHPAIGSREELLESLPQNGREIVSRQLSELPKATRNALAIASILGEKFSARSLSTIMNISATTAVERLTPAIRAWIIRENSGSFEFSHALLRDALYHTLEPAIRKRTHLLVAREILSRTDANLRAAEASHHLSSAAPLSDPVEACRYATIAGESAATRFAYTEAAAFFERALDLNITTANEDLETRFSIMQQLATAKLYTQDRSGARTLLLESAQLARELQSPSRLAECALALSPDFLSIEVGIYDISLVTLLEESLQDIGKEDLAVRAKLLARLSQAGQWAEPAAKTEATAIAALECARASNDNDALLAALTARAESLHGPTYARERLTYITELGDFARQTGNIPAMLLHQTRSITAHLELGNIKNVEIENENYRNLAAATKLPQYNWYPGATDAMLSLMRGEIDLAEHQSNAYKKAAGAFADQNLIQTYACHAILRAIERDNSQSVINTVSTFAEKQTLMHVWSAAIPWLYWDAGNYTAARIHLNRFTEERIREMSREPGGGVGIALLSEVAAALEDRDRASWLYNIISPIYDQFATVGYGVAYLGSFARYAGLLANTLGKRVEAIEFLLHACEQEFLLRAPTWHAYALADLGALGSDLRRYSAQRISNSLEFIAQLDHEKYPRASRRIRSTTRELA